MKFTNIAAILAGAFASSLASAQTATSDIVGYETISLSSGEAELHGIAKAATHALGFRNMARGLQWAFGIQLFSDAVAAIGIARRRGAGKIKHLDCADLWVQEKVRT